MAPLNKNSFSSEIISGWSIYLNNGNNLSEFCQGLIEYFKTENTSLSYQPFSYPKLIDIDNDGKCELINFYIGYNTQGNGFSNLIVSNVSEFQYDPNNVQFKWSYKMNSIFNNLKGGNSVYPIYGDFRINETNSKILFISKSLKNASDRKNISYSHYNLGVDKNITTITQGGLTTQIDYKELDPSINPGLYALVKKEQYPYMELDKVSQSYVVSQLRQPSSNNEIRKQDFKYRGFLTHLQGKGMVGFRQTVRSSWYTDSHVNTKIWSGAEIDPMKEGVPIKEWSVKTNNDDALIFPSDLSENNNQLLSFKSTEYKIDKLLNGSLINSFTDNDKPNIVTAIVPTKTQTTDFKKSIISESEIEYDGGISGSTSKYYLPTKTTTSINGGFGVTTTEVSYTHNSGGIGKDYFIGRPSEKIEKVIAYSDSKGSTERYIYINNLLSGFTKYAVVFAKPNTLAEGIRETYQYDGCWGNLAEKKIEKVGGLVGSGSVPSIIFTEKAEYEDKGRFVIKKTDNLGLETSISYNNWGQILTQTDPFGIVLTNTYDAWGKLLTSGTNLSGLTKYVYKKESNGDAVVMEYNADGGEKISWTNELGQNYKTTTRGFRQGSYVSKSVEYDGLGRKTKEGEPYYNGEAPKWNMIAYDDTNYPESKATATSFTGKIMETSVSGRTTIVKENNGNLRTTTKTTDELGNVVTSTDKGGIINFTYNASGQQLSATYGTNKVTTQYDNWERKIELHDPSNGIYKYNYDIFGNLIKETSPKGYKAYTYNSKAQLINQKEVSDDGVSTNKNINYNYNSKGLITDKIGTANGKTYSSNIYYDNFGRVLASSENSNGKYFMRKNITYDDKMRVISYEKSLYSGGQYTKVTVENVYNVWSGDLYQVKDKNQNKVLWELQNTEADGRVKNALLGGAKIENTYAADNFLISTSHNSLSNNATVLQMSYSFNAIKNELNSRSRGGKFNISELFQYDENNRLYNWTNPVTGAFTYNALRNTYDEKGRILKNDQVGEFTFGNSNKIYQPTKMVLNTEGQQNYTNNLIQKINYNENNDPIFIDGVKGDVGFTYGLSNIRQMATYGGNFDKTGEGKFTKYYSEDGSYEVIRNNQTGQEKHILYIGGTPYESNIVYLKDFVESSGSYKFLHKDYLGSILAISDEAGNTIEQRHFDAWGNFTHLKVGANTMIVGVDQVTNYLVNNNLLVYRGYTSHEHFMEVGIIHMNGRLYDPLLRRFLNADENIQDMFNTQNYNKYGYVLNNPLMYNDSSGEFLFIPILVAAMYGAAICAGVAAVTYSIQGLITGNWSMKGFVKAILGGAIVGAISGGFSGLGKQLFTAGSFMLESGSWNFLTNMVSMFIVDGKIDFANIGASMVGAYAGSKLPNWNALKGKGFGGWMRKGFEGGFSNGVGQAAFMIGTFGATYKPSEKQLEIVKKMSEKYKIDYKNVKWRTGGIYNLLIPNAAVTWGNNVSTTNRHDSPGLLGHEFGHIIQVQTQGWANFQAKGIWEQIYLKGIKGIDVYNTKRWKIRNIMNVMQIKNIKNLHLLLKS